MVSTFVVSEGGIPGNGLFHISKDSIPDAEAIEITSEYITHCDGKKLQKPLQIQKDLSKKKKSFKRKSHFLRKTAES